MIYACIKKISCSITEDSTLTFVFSCSYFDDSGPFSRRKHVVLRHHSFLYCGHFHCHGKNRMDQIVCWCTFGETRCGTRYDVQFHAGVFYRCKFPNKQARSTVRSLFPEFSSFFQSSSGMIGQYDGSTGHNLWEVGCSALTGVTGCSQPVQADFR